MRRRFVGSLIVAAAFVAGTSVLPIAPVTVSGQSPAKSSASGPSIKTPWGEPDLQGIWTDEYQIPLQRPVQFANKAEFTQAEVDALDKERAALLRRDQRVERGSERDVAGAYNAVFQSVRRTGRRTSLIVDPADGRIPALTDQATKKNEVERNYRLALLQATNTCKNKEVGCTGGTYGPPSALHSELPPSYNTGRLNRTDGPEYRSMAERCMSGSLPDFGGYRRIVQGQGSVTIFYDTGQGQGWQRNIPMGNTPHLPSNIRQWWGDSRGHWEGNTLVVDVTNFSPKASYLGSTENLHLVERFTRTGPNTIEYAVTIDDPTVWTRPWTVKQEMLKQDDASNRIYYEPRCHEGNYGLPGLLVGGRSEDQAFAEGRGPDPRMKDTATDFGGEGGVDPLTGVGGGGD